MPAQASNSDMPLFSMLETLPQGEPEAFRDAAVPLIAAWRTERLNALHERFLADNDGEALIHALSGLTDEIIRALYRIQLPGAPGIAVIATGGYGRQELFPYSDLDLLFLYRPAARAAAERMARTMLYMLWDLGLKVGHALRSMEDTLEQAQADLIIRTGLLDARCVAGDAGLCAEMTARLRKEIIAGTGEEFAAAKLAEREERHRRFGDSRYLLEPNVKESKGALRDLHTLRWIANYLYSVDDIGRKGGTLGLTPEECRAFARAQRFLTSLRVHLHYAAGKADERLTFDRQQAIAPRMGYKGREHALAVERLMKRYFLTAASVGGLTRNFCALLESQRHRTPRMPLAARLQSFWKLDGFVLEGERLSVRGNDEFARDPLRMLKLFQVAQKHGYDIHPQALRQVAKYAPLAATREFRADARANALFLEMLLSEDSAMRTLHRMHESGLLGRFIPEFGRIRGQMQFNMYHIYTVDEHTLVALGILTGLERGERAQEMPLATALAKSVPSRRVLYLALFCHDIAKGGGDDHSHAGALLAREMAERFGFSAQETGLCEWLVRHHLLFTHTAFKRDAADPATLRDFVGAVQSLERLKLLFLLTVADMSAVGPGIWNAWKATLLRNLYARAEAYIKTGQVDAGEDEQKEHRASLIAALPGWTEAAVDAYLALCPPECRDGLDVKAHQRVAELSRRAGAEPEPLLLDTHRDAARGITELYVVTHDRKALFSLLAGAISLTGINIVGAKIFTLTNGMAVDIFMLQDAEGKLFERADRLSRLQARIRQAFAGEIDLTRELSRQRPAYVRSRDAIPVTGRVFIENDASATHTVVEVTGRDRVGFLHAVTRIIAAQGLSIGSAHISTYGAQAVDVFYVKDGFGHKITHPQKLEQLRHALLEVVSEGPDSEEENGKNAKSAKEKD